MLFLLFAILIIPYSYYSLFLLFILLLFIRLIFSSPYYGLLFSSNEKILPYDM